MQEILSPEQMRGVEKRMMERGVPGLVLMEHAARGVADEALRRLPRNGRALILCGGGSNGGDGLSALRQLCMRGADAVGALFVSPEKLAGDALAQYRMATGSGLPLIDCSAGFIEDTLTKVGASLLIDALLGTGLSREVTGSFARAVAWMNGAGLPVISVDIPSGVDAETGRVLGTAVRADATVTFQNRKLGHLLFPGRERSGSVSVVPIGIGESVPGAAVVFEEEDIRSLLPPRPADSHKGKNGRALLAAGSAQYAGAALLAASAALRGGCGLLHAAVPQGIRNVFAQCPGAICHPAGSGGEWDEDAARDVLPLIEQAGALGIGPGAGKGEGLPSLLRAFLAAKKPLVIDADGLNALSAHRELFPLLHGGVVLTPHPAEMARLTGRPMEEILARPLRAAQEAARSWGCAVILKGATSVIAEGGQTCLNATGNTGLAKAGSGDVLTGILLALLAQGLPPFPAACAAAYLLGASAEKAYALLATRMLTPTDVTDALSFWSSSPSGPEHAG